MVPTELGSIDEDLARLQDVVARQRANRWHGGDVMGPEFEAFLAAVTRTPDPAGLHYGAELPANPEWRRHRNNWREVVHDIR